MIGSGILVICFFLIASCKSISMITPSTVNNNSKNGSMSQPQILFVEGSVVHDSLTGLYKITGLHMHSAYGQLKTSRIGFMDSSDSTFICEITDNKQHQLSVYPLGNLMKQHYEEFKDDGSIEGHVTIQDSAFFFLRMPMEKEAASLVFKYQRVLLDSFEIIIEPQ